MHKQDRRLVLSWLTLLVLTVFSFESAWGVGWLREGSAGLVFVIGVAMLKVRIVIMNFMEVRHAPVVLRAPLEIWVVALAAGIVGTWLLSGV
jgi:hypothetical protein